MFTGTTLDMIDLCRKTGIPEPELEQRGAQFVLTIRRKERPRQEPPTQSAGQVTGQVAGQVTGQLVAIPDKPNSRLQKYPLTPKGAGYLKARGGEESRNKRKKR